MTLSLAAPIKNRPYIHLKVNIYPPIFTLNSNQLILNIKIEECNSFCNVQNDKLTFLSATNLVNYNLLIII